jgi:hypothetical protein
MPPTVCFGDSLAALLFVPGCQGGHLGVCAACVSQSPVGGLSLLHEAGSCLPPTVYFGNALAIF